ncbi:tRNA (adenosine(37)-N6)-threonylcarbamoyltransferase complex transferase subunit TsaD [Candidatus Gottesmanbacteria bacterium RIFCSPHIGHO2_02_FULL_40_13]|uniref:tRNA N6-adenosine threonylcarbamoyltransferase n=1 Tax=Candidatus Gottesmanbacteria bacterium RIFCSPHIGHO2_02_FULL_40_13 TaxID=1798384 RepID=A0A1F6ABJ5_9BACT|nr:MAG: tRNA (adenosine(37)-N6)-threonylcarbamoyltransferase complex transferase subunit TsaD [Candidatus Gottesmanbacteria bacterium RIFCSPHIGHO2_02_FULL_40_13]
MKILAIETSCDETAAAVVVDGRQILSNIVASSMPLHKKTGGIIPEIAARKQLEFILPVIEKALRQAKLKPNIHMPVPRTLFDDIDLIAVTTGPGLIGSLLIGVETAKTLSLSISKPLVGVNHIHAHLYANWLNSSNQPGFPAIGLVVSGGHTELFLLTSHENIKWLGGTRDDAAGEAFDKTARLLGLGYPGGPAVSAAAEKFQISNSKFQNKIKLPRPMINSNDLDFSFSGLKTAVIREINKLKTMKQWNNEAMVQLAYEIQESITDVLVKKTLQASQQYNVKSIIIGGGVAANKRLTEKFHLAIRNLELEINLHIPPPALCTDNAAYIASFAFYHQKQIRWQELKADPQLPVEV